MPISGWRKHWPVRHFIASVAKATAREGGGLSLDGDEEVRAAGRHLRAHGASKRVKPPRETHSLVAQHVAIRAEDVDGRKPAQLRVRGKGGRDERIPRDAPA